MNIRRIKNSITLAAVVIVYLALVLSGCASTSQVQSAQSQADLALQEAKQAKQESQTAKSMAEGKTMEAVEAAKRAEMAAQRAEQSAADAETFADKAEAMADKTEKIFMQKNEKIAMSTKPIHSPFFLQRDRDEITSPSHLQNRHRFT
jgi:hypothetical protein